VSTELHTIASAAGPIGRFEMHLTPVGTSKRATESRVDLERFKALGFSTAASIRVFRPEDGSGLKPETLLQLGRKAGSGWELGAPAESNAGLWRRLLRADMPIVLEAPHDPNWVRLCVAQLYAPIIYYTGSAALTDEVVKYCRARLKGAESEVFVVFSPWHRVVGFFGVGALFEVAIGAMSKMPGEVYGYSSSQRKDLLRGGFRLFRKRVGG
jgi:hypothetical protein